MRRVGEVYTPKSRDEDPVLKKNRSGALYLKQWEILKSLRNEYLYSKSLLFCFHTSGVRRTIDVLDSENPPEYRKG